MANILIVSAHPDDEVLGCGAAIQIHKMNGDKVVICSDGNLLVASYEGEHENQR